jgi:hypothetical protein
MGARVGVDERVVSNKVALKIAEYNVALLTPLSAEMEAMTR